MDRLVAELGWYVSRANHGRGRMTGAAAKLFEAGYLTRSWTSANCWVLTISQKGLEYYMKASARST